MKNKGEIIVYQSKDGKTSVEVALKENTLWLNLNQIAKLFGRDKSVVSRHLNKVFSSGELEKKAVVAKNATTASDGKTYQVEFYNLDAIISIGYRVNSLRGTQFRIWATNVLKQHLIEGYSVNAKRLKELKQTIKLVGNVVEKQAISGKEAAALLKVVSDYAYALDVLDDYDYKRIKSSNVSKKKAKKINYKDAKKIIEILKKEFNESIHFGAEKDESLKSSLANVFQTYDGKDLYQSIEEKSANLLYFLVKNHSFVDGNKRIAAALFLCFLQKNNFLYRKNGSKRIADNALVAITLMIAESDPKEKNIICNVVMNLINNKN